LGGNKKLENPIDQGRKEAASYAKSSQPAPVRDDFTQGYSGSQAAPNDAQMRQLIAILSRRQGANFNLTVTNTTGSNVAISTNAAAAGA
jgi:hypothetical protein